jgi:hypothetical protein
VQSHALHDAVDQAGRIGIVRAHAARARGEEGMDLRDRHAGPQQVQVGGAGHAGHGDAVAAGFGARLRGHLDDPRRAAIAPQFIDEVQVVAPGVRVVGDEHQHQGAPVDEGLGPVAEPERRFETGRHRAIGQLAQFQRRLARQRLQ